MKNIYAQVITRGASAKKLILYTLGAILRLKS